MNWTRMSAIAEVVSSAAILVTLVYLAVQTRQLTAQTRQNVVAIQSSVRQGMLALDVQWLLDVANTPGRSQLWCKPELTDLEKSEMHVSMLALLRMREAQWLQYKDGALDEETWRTLQRALTNNLSNPRAREWWNRVRNNFYSEFSDNLDAYLATITPDRGCVTNAID